MTGMVPPPTPNPSRRVIERICERPGCGCVVQVSLYRQDPPRYCGRECASKMIGEKLRNRTALPPAWTVLSEDEVRMIRASTESNPVLAKRLGVSTEAVREARVGKTWRFLR